jgi:hypothetical protein
MEHWSMHFDRDQRSSDCTDGRHDDCGHSHGSVGRFFGKQSPSQVSLCQCECHEHCAIASDQLVREESWYAQCDCPGAEASKQWHNEFAEERAERKRITDEIRASFDTRIPKSRSEFRTELEHAYDQRGIEPKPYELDSLSGALEAASGPSHLAVPRILGTFGRRISNAVKDFRQAGSE